MTWRRAAGKRRADLGPTASLRCDDLAPSAGVDLLLVEIAADPTGIV
jgi:hypothetical protein